MFKAENDQQVMTCRASVSGLITNATSESIISVFCWFQSDLSFEVYFISKLFFVF